MLFNEENTKATTDSDVDLQSSDIDSESKVDCCNEGDEIDLSNDDLSDQGSQDDTIHEGVEDSFRDMPDSPDMDMLDDIYAEDVELNYDELKKNNFGSEVNHNSSKQTVDLDYDDLSDQGSQDDTIHESVSPISFSEKGVRIFQRTDYNLITESDFTAVMNYYNYNLSEEEILGNIAECNNISEDSIKVLVESGNIVDKKIKKVKPTKSSAQIKLDKFNDIKKRMSPEKFKAQYGKAYAMARANAARERAQKM